MLKSLKEIDWLAIGASALLLVALLLIVPTPPQEHQNINTSYTEPSQIITPRSADERVADYTRGVEIFTAVLALVACFQVWLLLRAETTASISANAAKKAADVAERTLTDLETPFLYPLIGPNQIWQHFHNFRMYDHENSPVGDARPNVTFVIKNYGRTPALLRSVSAQFDHLTEMVAEPHTNIFADHAVEPVLEAGQHTSRTFTKVVTVPISREAYRSIQAATSRLFLYGEVIFADIFGNDYTQTFCLAWDNSSKGFIPWSSRYNQRKRHESKKQE